MIHPCDKPCGNKTASGYCATTACINPQYSNIGTEQYGQGVQKRIVTNADRIRSMTDEELANFLALQQIGVVTAIYKAFDEPVPDAMTGATEEWLDWLREEAEQ